MDFDKNKSSVNDFEIYCMRLIIVLAKQSYLKNVFISLSKVKNMLNFTINNKLAPINVCIYLFDIW